MSDSKDGKVNWKKSYFAALKLRDELQTELTRLTALLEKAEGALDGLINGNMNVPPPKPGLTVDRVPQFVGISTTKPRLNAAKRILAEIREGQSRTITGYMGDVNGPGCDPDVP